MYPSYLLICETIMNVSGLLKCLEFIIETQKLRKLGLTREEIEGYFEFDWDLGTDLITEMLRRETDAQH